MMSSSAAVDVSVSLRAALLEILSTGRAMTVAEIRPRLDDYGFGHLPAEPLYRNLASLKRSGEVRRIDHAAQPRAYWAIAQSAALRLQLPEAM